MPFAVVEEDVNVELAQLGQLEALLDKVLGSLAFCVSHLDWVSDWFQFLVTFGHLI